MRFIISGSVPGTSTATSEIHDWLTENAATQQLDVQRVPFSAMDSWSFQTDDGRLAHDSGRFFSIEGLHVRTNFGWRRDWIQPIIVQPEIGFLGLIVKEFDGVLHLLVQAKAEPGNINAVQLSPTVQATRSNYTGVHRGSKVRFLEYFNGTRPKRTLVDVLQSEQGAWFLRKRNRNVIVEVFDDLPDHPNFRWLTLPQLRAMLHCDNVVNMDLRTVLACIPTVVGGSQADEVLASLPRGFPAQLLHSFIGGGTSVHNMNTLLSWISDVRTRRELVQRTRPLQDIERSGWIRTDNAIEHEEKKYFDVFGVTVRTTDREVNSWMQPLLSPANCGLLALLVKDIGGTFHALVQLRTEAGGVDVAELAPTVHCQPENYAGAPEEDRPSYVDYVINAPRKQIRYDGFHSEEGGRFYRSENRYMLIEVPDDFGDSDTPDHRWMTFDQITYLIGHSHYANIQLRSLVAIAAAVYTGNIA
ncbi:NDP-hexose 2,3-dehydratase family protein [Rhodococcus sp. ABRD24]|uniref:NDP-hexose 2,3-dehydratase family protein n=1 Tax=Rhodococcus sp. ABRD24 TaxID=2507582 RepID=UPI001A9556F8|nr:NDP-hexose 2,3-dehydratase family protein [Rhodococcus sp. ABRD24]